MEEELLTIVEKETMIPRERLRMNASLDDLGIASIDVISVLFAIEEKYGVEIQGEELSDARTVGDFVHVLATRIAEQS